MENDVLRDLLLDTLGLDPKMVSNLAVEWSPNEMARITWEGARYLPKEQWNAIITAAYKELSR